MFYELNTRTFGFSVRAVSETSGSNERLIPRVISIELGEVFGPAERAWLPDGELRPHHCVPVRLSRIDNQNGE